MLKKDALIFLTGCCMYPTLEMLWRTKTHFTMAIAGGICMVLINWICCEWLDGYSLIIRSAVGAGIITVVELVLGYIVNYRLEMNIWDYSDFPMNLLGQVCLPYSIIWMILIIPAMGLCKICSEAEMIKEV